MNFPKDLKQTLVIVIAWWILVTGIALLASNRLNMASDTAYTWIDPAAAVADSWNPLALIIRWDAVWFQDIAQNGYQYNGPGQLSNIAFFPIFPLATRLLGWIFLNNTELAGWIISLLALIGSAYFLRRLVAEFHPKANKDQTLLFLLCFPAAVFFWAPYTETSLMFFSIAGLYFARRGNFWTAGALGFLAALARPPGFLIFIPLVIEYWIRYRKGKLIRPSIISLALPPLGLISYFTYLWFAFGDPLAYFTVQSAWGRSFVLNADHFITASSAAVSNLGMDVLYLTVGLALSLLVLWRVRVSYGLYCLAMIILPIATGTLMSIGRYVGVLFPIYIAVSQIFPKTAKHAWTFASILLFGLTLSLYVNGYWAG